MPTALPFTLCALRDAYAGGLSPEDVIREAYRRIEAAGDDAIFLHLPPLETAAGVSRELGDYDPALPLWGVPFVVKDNIDVAGMPTTAACPAFEYMAETDAFAVAQLRAAGALPLGKTNLDQFATGLVGTRSPYGVPRNPHDPALVPGGSSSGSAVAVARALVDFALGTDTAGSGRVPAAFCGLVGLKPTRGRIPTTGVVPAVRSADVVSVFAASVDTTMAVMAAAGGPDGLDGFCRTAPPPTVSPRPLRVGVLAPASLVEAGITT